MTSLTKTHIVTISGPSLSGKTELSKMLAVGFGFGSVVSHTTRAKRAHEVDGVDYNFVSEDEFNKIKFIQTTKFSDNLYGVSEDEVLKKNRNVLLWVIAPGSINQVETFCKENNCNLTKIFVTNPHEVLFDRLMDRYYNDQNADPVNYLKRVYSMFKVEGEWVKEVVENPEKYDLVFMKFNENNTNDVLNVVLNKISEKNDDFFLFEKRVDALKKRIK